MLSNFILNYKLAPLLIGKIGIFTPKNYDFGVKLPNSFYFIYFLCLFFGVKLPNLIFI